MKTMKMLAALAVFAFAIVAVFAVAGSADADDAYTLKGYGASEDQDVDTVGKLTAFYYEKGTNYRLNIKLTTVPAAAVSVHIEDKTTHAAIQTYNVVQSGSSIWLNTVNQIAAGDYVVTVTSNGGDYFSTDPTPTKQITCDLNVSTAYYKVSFNANGGTGVMIDQYIPAGGATLNTMNFTGATDEGTSAAYDFGGWNKDEAEFAYADASELLADGASFTPTADTTLYAEWMYTITYKANGGTGDDIVKDHYTTATGQTVAANTFTVMTGTDFAGWMTKTNDDYDFTKTTSEEMAKELILPGVGVPTKTTTYWAIYTYHILFKDNAANTWGQIASAGADETQDVLVATEGLLSTDDKLVTSTAFEADYIYFLGWAKSAAATEADFAKGAVVPIVNTTATGSFVYNDGPLYAIWAPVTYDITIIGTNSVIGYIEAIMNTRTAAPTSWEDSVPKDLADSKVLITVNHWDKITIKAKGNYVINSIIMVNDDTSTVYTTASDKYDDATKTFTFTEFEANVSYSITDKSVMSVYNVFQGDTTTGEFDISVKQDGDSTVKLYYNDVVFDGTSGVLIIEKLKAVNLTFVGYYDMADWKEYDGKYGFYSNDSGTPSEPEDLNGSKIADGRYQIPYVAGKDIALVIEFEEIDVPYQDFYMKSAVNKVGTETGDETVVTVVINSATDTPLTWTAGDLVLKGTGYISETINGEPVVVYTPISSTDFPTAGITGSPAEFKANDAALKVYYVYAQYTYEWHGAKVSDQCRGIIAMDTYTIQLSATDGTSSVQTELTGMGTYIDGSQATVTAQNAAQSKTFSGWYLAEDTSFAHALSTSLSYTFVVEEDKELVAKYS